MEISPRRNPAPAAGATRGHARLAAVPDPELNHHPRVQPYWTAIVIRPAVAADSSALQRLADLDSARRPTGETVLAEQGGSLVAAVSLSDGASIADPFRATADIVGLLQIRAGQMQRAGVA